MGGDIEPEGLKDFIVDDPLKKMILKKLLLFRYSGADILNRSASNNIWEEKDENL